MTSIPLFYIGYVDGMNRSSQNVASTTWVTFSSNNEFLDSRGIFLGRATSNLDEYEVVISLMTNASAIGIL